MIKILLPFVFAVSCTCTASAPDRDYDGLSRKIDELRAKYVCYSGSDATDSVLYYCAKAEKPASAGMDSPAKFKAKQLAVSAMCSKGDISLGIAAAMSMYEEAKKEKDDFGTAMAVQAMGITYLHTGKYAQAYEAFSEARPAVAESGDTLSMVRLGLQMIYSALSMKDTALVRAALDETDGVFPGLADERQKNVYLFYRDCCRAAYLSMSGETDQAYTLLETTATKAPDDKVTKQWLYYTWYRFYSSSGQNSKALEYNDSLLNSVKKNGSQYLLVLRQRAALMEKAGDYGQAYRTYENVNYLADSLNALRYTKQINAMHMTYWVDDMALKNISAHNRLMAIAIVCGAVILVMAFVLAVIIKKRNRRLEQSLMRLEAARKSTADSIQSKSMFLSNMSHDLRTPLNAIVGFSGILTDSVGADAETKEMCRQNIRQNSDLLIKLVNDITDLSDLKDSRIKFSWETTDAVALCRNVIETVEKVKRTAAVISFGRHPESLMLYTDGGRLRQVLINLLVNADKFTEEGAITLDVDVDETSGMAVFSVEDTGCGIPEELREKIFGRFEKLHEGVHGTGLGLSICKLILDHIGGSIWIDPEYTAGTRFVFTHPLPDRKKQAES